MDCRKALFPAVWLLTGALGCTHRETVPVVPVQTVAPPVATTPVKHDQKVTKHDPKPESCVAGGNWFASEAATREKGSTAREQLFDKARIAYQQALTIDPKYIPAHQGLGRLYVAMEDYERSVATYQKALQIHPKNAVLWFDLGIVQSRKKDWPGALDSLGRAVDLEPENRQYINTLGFALARTGQYQIALACFSRVNTEAQANYHLARMLHHLQQFDQCRQCLQTAIQKDPSFEPAQTMLASLSAPAAAPRGVQPVNYTDDGRDGPPDQIAPPAEPRPVILPAPPTSGR